MSEEQPGQKDILGQFRELGKNLEDLIRQAWESDQVKDIRDQFSRGLGELNEQLDQAADKARESQVAKGLGQQVKATLDKAGADKVADSLRRGITQALETLNEQLNHLIESLPEHKSRRGEDQDER